PMSSLCSLALAELATGTLMMGQDADSGAVRFFKTLRTMGMSSRMLWRHLMHLLPKGTRRTLWFTPCLPDRVHSI
ncbi:hypothetical protein FRB91_007701, partial [Serendipita sp. 411]